MPTPTQSPTWRRCCVLVLACVALGGCTSTARKTAVNLDTAHPRYASRECQMAMSRAQWQDRIKHTRMLASPVAVLLSGGAWLLPVLALNAGLDTVDHLEASDISVDCGGPETPNADIAKEVLMGVGFGLGAGK